MTGWWLPVLAAGRRGLRRRSPGAGSGCSSSAWPPSPAPLFIVAPEGRLWNARVLPFWYLCLYLLAGVAWPRSGPPSAGCSPPIPTTRRRSRQSRPSSGPWRSCMFVGHAPGRRCRWLPKPATTDTSFIPDWAKWNYSGYERKDAYPEYKSGHRH